MAVFHLLAPHIVTSLSIGDASTAVGDPAAVGVSGCTSAVRPISVSMVTWQPRPPPAGAVQVGARAASAAQAQGPSPAAADDDVVGMELLHKDGRVMSVPSPRAAPPTATAAGGTLVRALSRGRVTTACSAPQHACPETADSSSEQAPRERIATVEASSHPDSLPDPVRGELDHISTQDAHRVLRTVPLIKLLPDADRRRLAQQLEARRYKLGDVVVAQGDLSDAMFFVESGSAIAVKGGKTVKHYVAGDYFGERGLLFSEPRAATVKVNVDAVCLKLGRAAFEQVASKAIETMMERVDEEQRVESRAALLKKPPARTSSHAAHAHAAHTHKRPGRQRQTTMAVTLSMSSGEEEDEEPPNKELQQQRELVDVLQQMEASGKRIIEARPARRTSITIFV